MKIHNFPAILTCLLLSPSIVIADTTDTTPPEMRQLLQGEIATGADKKELFSLEGERRDKVVGGALQFGTKTFTVEKMSVHSLVGAKNNAEGISEFAVFSSSYSEQVATGKPWIAATTSHHCDEPYNSFLAVYTLTDSKKLKQLPGTPYSALVDATDVSDESVVYCFMAQPPKPGT